MSSRKLTEFRQGRTDRPAAYHFVFITNLEQEESSKVQQLD